MRRSLRNLQETSSMFTFSKLGRHFQKQRLLYFLEHDSGTLTFLCAVGIDKNQYLR